MSLQTEQIGIYIAIEPENNFYEADLAALRERISIIDWSYASHNFSYMKNQPKQIWWIGWTEDKNKVAVQELVPRIKSIINEVARGAYSGEISSSHQ